MHHKIVRIGSWFFAMALYMCFANISARAATTPPIWYLEDANNIPGLNARTDGTVYYDGEYFYVITPYKTIVDGGEYVNAVANRYYTVTYNAYQSYPFSTNNPVTGIQISEAIEPFSFYDFKVDSNWYIYCYNSTHLKNNTRFFACSRKDLSDVAYTTVTTSDFDGSDVTGDRPTTIGTYTTVIRPGQLYYTNNYSGSAFGSYNKINLVGNNNLWETRSDSININELMICGFVPLSDVSVNSYQYASGQCMICLLVPTTYVPRGLQFGDVWPVGNGGDNNALIDRLLSDSKIQTDAQYDVTKATLDAYASESGNLSQWNTDLGFDFTTVAPQFIQPWMVKIMLLMMGFGVLAIFIRRSLHD